MPPTPQALCHSVGSHKPSSIRQRSPQQAVGWPAGGTLPTGNHSLCLALQPSIFSSPVPGLGVLLWPKPPSLDACPPCLLQPWASTFALIPASTQLHLTLRPSFLLYSGGKSPVPPKPRYMGVVAPCGI